MAPRPVVQHRHLQTGVQAEVQLLPVGEPRDGGKVRFAAKFTFPPADQEGQPVQGGWHPAQVVPWIWCQKCRKNEL